MSRPHGVRCLACVAVAVACGDTPGDAHATTGAGTDASTGASTATTGVGPETTLGSLDATSSGDDDQPPVFVDGTASEGRYFRPVPGTDLVFAPE